MRKIILISLMSVLFLAGAITYATAAQVVPMQDANNFAVAVKTEKEVYSSSEPIKIYAQIVNNSNQIIDFTTVLSYYEIKKLSDTNSINDEPIIEPYYDPKTGIYVLDHPGVPIYFKAYPNSTRLGFIGVYAPTATQRLSPGKYVIRVKFAENQYDAPPLCDSQKIITIQR